MEAGEPLWSLSAKFCRTWLEQAPRLWLWTPLLPGSLSLHKTSAGQTWVRKISQRQTFGLTLDITSRHTGTYQAEPPLPLPLECLTQDGLDPDIMDSSVQASEIIRHFTNAGAATVGLVWQPRE